ncbi:tyrosine-type recombinase/integrase [Paenibacillus larvae]|uniref:Integrase n=8 Tax=root TaxID=1 RepID=A0A0C5AJI3_9CAUD|nr:site-specific integrase [Paenibacillus larvae]YP_009195219.1 integrase [Paenibacillus phage HB10c2]YP_009203482.1 integrase [Paenibacillus phage Sitara]YP_009224895.1 integrase [Paenibacillus phage Rani]YP_009836584.1 integrase [Paenibacillus phage Leyra]YP_009838866.1 integrase [Paenibacillus phage Eltigre]AJK27888.1 integrase [Bacteriophage Redbud]AUS03652.1 integrase [Paenibacillus phage Kiel007]AJD83041.1 integrase [Paenibacillus phage HB10c2]AJK27827.2 integrase [Paenibacillus phag
MKGHFYKPNCKCPGKKTKKCSCGATWSYIIDVGINPNTGKRKQKKKGGFKTKTEAQEAAALLVAELSQGTYVEEKNNTFEEYAKEWLSEYQATGTVKISTVRIRKKGIKLLLPYLAKLRISIITAKQYQHALLDLHDKGYSNNTIVSAHQTGRMIFQRAIELKIIKNDPTSSAVIPKRQRTIEDLETEKEIPKYMEKEELALFLQTAKEKGLDRDYAIFLTLAYTGMRVGELCALKWSDIDFSEQTVSITKTYYNPNNNIKNYTLLTPKTKSSKRVIIVDKKVLDELEQLQAEQKRIKMFFRKTYHDKNFVFSQQGEENAGFPTYPKLVALRMTRLLKLAGLNTKLTPHSLRHTHTSLLAEARVSLEQIMQRLGHRSDETTKNIYLHVTKPKKKEASQKFAELMSSF